MIKNSIIILISVIILTSVSYASFPKESIGFTPIKKHNELDGKYSIYPQIDSLDKNVYRIDDAFQKFNRNSKHSNTDTTHIYNADKYYFKLTSLNKKM